MVSATIATNWLFYHTELPKRVSASVVADYRRSETRFCFGQANHCYLVLRPSGQRVKFFSKTSPDRNAIVAKPQRGHARHCVGCIGQPVIARRIAT